MARTRTRTTTFGFGIGFGVAALLVALVLAAFVSPFASSSPDGLEKVAAEKGFLDTARDSAAVDSPLADYAVRDVDNERVSTGLSGIIGVFLTVAVAAAVFGGIGFVMRRRDGSPPATHAMT